MRKTIFIISFLISTLLVSAYVADAWGFFGHRRINRMAVFSLPPEMILFFKQNIEFITEHAVDPDKRRYATKHEAVRHYIDVDHWGVYPFENVPRVWEDVMTKYMNIYVVDQNIDTFLLTGPSINVYDENRVLHVHSDMLANQKMPSVKYTKYRDFIESNALVNYYEDAMMIDCDSLINLLSDNDVNINCIEAYAEDTFSKYGILPYHLVVMQKRLTMAFEAKDPKRILQLAAEMGHYIGDAHVPLHTTENYNGQMTNQDGIHAFWESRIPELFADDEFDYLVGQAEYIENKGEYFWDIVLESNTYVDSMLAIEKKLSITFPQDKQYCYEDRLQQTIRTQCREYTAEFRRQLDGQVEARMTAAMLSVASSWFTAWVDAGQPNLDNLGKYDIDKELEKELKELEKYYNSGDGEIKGRSHGN